MSRNWLTGVALMMIAAAPMAWAQTVDIGGTALDLGMPRADALAIANARFELSPSRIRGQYTVYPKRAPGQSSGPLQPALGSLTVRGDRLVRVTRNLGSFRSREGEAAIDNLIMALAQAPGDGNAPSVHTDSALSGGASTSRVYFSYPDRAIQIVIYRPADLSGIATIDITEQYALPEGDLPPTALPR